MTSVSQLESSLLQTSLRESRQSEDAARSSSRALARELAAARENLSASRLQQSTMRTVLEESSNTALLQTEQEKRAQQRLALKTDEAGHTARLLDAAQRDLRRRDDDNRQKDAHIRHLENTLRLRQEAHADLKLLLEDLRRDQHEKQDVIVSLQRTLSDVEERLAIAREDGRRAEENMRVAREQRELREKDLLYEIEALKQSRAAAAHDLESAVSAVRDREDDLQYAGKRIKELEGYIATLRKEVQMREEKLDHRQEEVQTWTTECERLRRQLEETRQRAVQASTEFDKRLKEEKLRQQELEARASSFEVETSVAVAAKTDLIHDVNRLQKRVDEQDAQIRRLTRALEEKDHRIAEIAPMAREVERARSATLTSTTTSTRSRTITGAPRVNRPTLAKTNLRLIGTSSVPVTTSVGSSKWRY